MDEAIIEEAVMALILEEAVRYFGADDADCLRAAAVLASRRGIAVKVLMASIGVSEFKARGLCATGMTRADAAFERGVLIVEKEVGEILLSAIGGAFVRAEAA